MSNTLEGVSLETKPASECPLLDLIDKPMTEMDDTELEEHLTSIRQALASHQSLRALVNTKQSAKNRQTKQVTKANLSMI